MSDESLPHPDAAAFDAAGCRTMLFQGVRAVGGHGRRTNGVIRTVRARGGGEFSRGRRGGSDNERRDGKRRSEESRVGAPVRPRQADTAARTCPQGRSRPTRTAAPAPEADPVHEHGHGTYKVGYYPGTIRVPTRARRAGGAGGASTAPLKAGGGALERPWRRRTWTRGGGRPRRACWL